MKKLTCTIVLSLFSLRAFAAADAVVVETAGKPAAATLEVKNKSSFAMDDHGRNPFWPIGWKPALKQNTSSTEQQAGPEISPTSFVVSSITVDQSGRFAIINGKTMTEGQVFGLQVGNQTYQITVKAIGDGQVTLLRRDQEIAIPLRRR